MAKAKLVMMICIATLSCSNLYAAESAMECIDRYKLHFKKVKSCIQGLDIDAPDTTRPKKITTTTVTTTTATAESNDSTATTESNNSSTATESERRSHEKVIHLSPSETTTQVTTSINKME